MATQILTRTLTAPVRVADRVRWLWLKALGPLAKPLVRQRELRVAVAGSTMLLLALVGAAVIPMWVLALGPIVWGTPHILSDVRYLWVRPGRHRRWTLWILVVVPLLAVSATAHPAWGFAASLGALVAARGAWWKRALLAPPLLALLYLAITERYLVGLLFGYAHNFIGLALWWAWRARTRKLHFIVVGVFVAGCALILSGGVDEIVLASGGLASSPGGLDIYYHLSSLAMGIPGMLGVRLVLLFCFTQSVHYLMWVRLVPDEDRQRETPRTFNATLRALRADFGAWLLGATIVVALGVAVWAAFDVFSARNGYLRAVLFHGHLEVAAIVLLLVEGSRPRDETEAAPA